MKNLSLIVSLRPFIKRTDYFRHTNADRSGKNGKAQGAVRTTAHTFPAPDALGMIGGSRRVHRHVAHPRAGSAVCTFATVNGKTHRRRPVEEGIERAERTEIFAEGAENHDRGQHHRSQHQRLPRKNPTEKPPQTAVGSRKEHAGQRPRRTEIFAVEWRKFVRHRQNDHHYDQHGVFDISQRGVTAERAQLPWRRNPEEQLLQKPEWTYNTYYVTGSDSYEYTYSIPGSEAYVMIPNEEEVAKGGRLLQETLAGTSTEENTEDGE